ncbi:hypothetical protein [Paracraurococcus lichenis]|uniref:Type IV secretion system protein VirB3 n=1 Tax=Paracraurococcus lichenis TaxID=3064888 RepID=A0ABT9EBI3_9PROT|nr:hypothetical protein [Paracraurococcus sp. LOR1-02]MDO9713250.1 hypothetical protein [Paracraurococcus sp. LOR1-02]
MDAGQPADVPLESATCEVEVTLPQMWLGLPRNLGSGLVAAAALGVVFIDSWAAGIALAASLVVVWVAAKAAVARDLWGFDNLLAWLATDARFLDIGGKDGWSGARLCGLPLTDRETRGVGHAPR